MATMPKTPPVGESPVVTTIELVGKGIKDEDKDSVTLSIGNQDQARFFCQNDDVHVVFDFDEGSPFERECFHVYRGDEGVLSGPVKRKGVPVGGRYRYNIKSMKGGGPSADPTIIIDE